MTVEIKLTRGYVATVDDCDSDLAAFKWHYKGRNGEGYACHRKGYEYELLHKLILERMLNQTFEKGQLGDHVNGDKLDCCRSNLRLATHTQNMRNQSNKYNKLGTYKGTSWSKRAQRWQSVIRTDSKNQWLGYFDTELEGHMQYCIASLTHHGEYGNFGANSPFVGWSLERLENLQTDIRKLTPVRGAQLKWTREAVEPLYADYLSGMNQKEVAAKHKVTQTWVSAMFKRYGFETRPQSEAVTLGKAKAA